MLAKEQSYLGLTTIWLGLAPRCPSMHMYTVVPYCAMAASELPPHPESPFVTLIALWQNYTFESLFGRKWSTLWFPGGQMQKPNQPLMTAAVKPGIARWCEGDQQKDKALLLQTKATAMWSEPYFSMTKFAEEECKYILHNLLQMYRLVAFCAINNEWLRPGLHHCNAKHFAAEHLGNFYSSGVEITV